MRYDEDLDAYVFETEGIMFSWEEEPEDDYEEEARVVAEKYKSHLPQIIEFMLPDLKEMYGDVDIDEVEEKLGQPIISIENGTVTYCEQMYDNIHIFTFEYLDDEFEDLQYFCIDG